MILIDRIVEDMKAAMKAGDKLRLGAIRMLRAAIKDKEIELGHSLSDDEVFALIAKLVKQRKDAASQYAEAGRNELEAKELDEAKIYQAYLPAQLSDDEVAVLVAEAIEQTKAVGIRDMGKVMGALKSKVQGRADMGKLSGMVKAQLSAA